MKISVSPAADFHKIECLSNKNTSYSMITGIFIKMWLSIIPSLPRSAV